MDWVGAFLGEVPRAATDPRIWIGVVQATALFLVATVVGRLVGRRVGLLSTEATETVATGVGLAFGLTILATIWATAASLGQSAFTPVAISFLVTIAMAVLPRSKGESRATPGPEGRRWSRRLIVCGGCVVFIAVAALVYGSTMALMARDGVQPIEFFDEAFYSVLARDLATTGREWLFSPSGFAVLPDTPLQTWYHWGELWLAAAVIAVFGGSPVDVRHFVVLPVILLAACAMSGAVVQAFAESRSRSAYLVGFLCCLFLAPIPLLSGPLHASWAVGLLFGVTVYGSAAVAAILALYCIAVGGRRPATWTLASAIAGIVVFLVPAHLIVAALGAIGLVLGVAFLTASRWRAGMRPTVPMLWRRTGVWSAVLLLATAAWGVATGHGIGASNPSVNIGPFDDAWQRSVLAVIVGSLLLLTVPIGWIVFRRERPLFAAICAGAFGLVLVGAIAWGLRFADFNMFHVFFAGIAVYLTPIAAAATWLLWERLRNAGRRIAALSLIVLGVVQLELGAIATVVRLQDFGPKDYDPVPVAVLEAIRDLPAGAKLAYQCQPLEEHSVWDPRLASIDAHTGIRVVTMCFQADAVAPLIGGPIDKTVEAPFFRFAPQRGLYPTWDAAPTTADVVAWLKANGVDYTYEDPVHGPLVPDDEEILAVGEFRVGRIP